MHRRQYPLFFPPFLHTSTSTPLEMYASSWPVSCCCRCCCCFCCCMQGNNDTAHPGHDLFVVFCSIATAHRCLASLGYLACCTIPFLFIFRFHPLPMRNTPPLPLPTFLCDCMLCFFLLTLSSLRNCFYLFPPLHVEPSKEELNPWPFFSPLPSGTRRFKANGGTEK